MRDMLALLLVAAALTACSNSPEEAAQKRADAEDLNRRVHAETVVERQLKDPDSARFEHVRVSTASGLPVVCGTVNAKNGFGGYSGPQPFYSAGEVAVIMTPQNAAALASQFKELCGL